MHVSIIGGGVFGLSAAHELALRGHRVELHEAGDIPATAASSHDVSKAGRLVYGTGTATWGPRFVDALERWRDLERAAGVPLFRTTGFLALATEWRDGGFEAESARALRTLGQPHEVLDQKDVARRFPGLAVHGVAAALLDPQGGCFDPDACLRALRRAAEARGAAIRIGARAADPEALAGDAVLITAGAWLGELARGLPLPLAVTRQDEVFFRPRDAAAARALPVWSFDIAGAGFYGFGAAASADGSGLAKVACHGAGPPRTPPRPDGPSAPLAAEPLEAARIGRFVADRLPCLDPAPAASRTCMYTMTPDGNFLFDRVPGSGRVFAAGGGSGHAFKFGPLLGVWAADLVEGKPVPREFALDRAAAAGRTVV